MLALAGEARYAWRRTISRTAERDVKLATEQAALGFRRKRNARRREDAAEVSMKGAPRRVSLTPRRTARRREADGGACAWPASCDSRRGGAQRLERRARPGLVAKAAEDTENVFRVP